MRKGLALIALLLASPLGAQVVNPPAMNTSNFVTQNQLTTATAPLATQSALTAVQSTIPTAATSAPPSVADTGTAGTQTMVYALANHTHASKIRKIRAQTAADGNYTFTFTTAFGVGVTPICEATAETTPGVTDVINAQINGTPTNTAVNVIVTRTNRSVVSLIGLTVLSIPTQPGVTWVHIACLEP